MILCLHVEITRVLLRGRHLCGSRAYYLTSQSSFPLFVGKMSANMVACPAAIRSNNVLGRTKTMTCLLTRQTLGDRGSSSSVLSAHFAS